VVEDFGESAVVPFSAGLPIVFALPFVPMKRIGILFVLVAGICGVSCIGALAQSPPATQSHPIGVSPPVRIQPPQPVPQLPLENFLAFDSQQKEVSVPSGIQQAQFVFNITNISSGDVVVNFVQTSCGCTVAKLPSQPWKLASKESGQISATMNLMGTPVGGSKIKTLTVSTDKGTKALFVKATILPAGPPPMTEMDRTNNQKIAMVNRQAVFTDSSCIQCHVATAKDAAGHDKTGKELFAAVCGVCHEAQHQASFVPNLQRLPEPTNAEFWRNWIMHGKPGTLMPAFTKSEGGILTDPQVESLVAYLTATVPPKPTAQNTVPVKTAIQ
jgi:mono/diheme cytochrome c family protein